MSEGFSVRWGDRSDSKLYAIDQATYPAIVEDVNWRKSRQDNDMAVVKFRFKEVRVTKPERGVAIERNRSLDNYFVFSSPPRDFQIESAFDYLTAAGAATKEELDAMGETDSEQLFKLFEDTRGVELGVRVQKRKADTDKNPGALVDEEGMENRIRDFYHKDSPQFERAANAVGATVDESKITFGGRQKKSRS